MSFKEKIMYGKFLFGIFLNGYPMDQAVTMFTDGNIVGGMNIPHPLCPHPLCPHPRAHNEKSIPQSRGVQDVRESRHKMPLGLFPEQNEKYTSEQNEMSISQLRCAWDARKSKGKRPPGFFPERNEKYSLAHNEMFTTTIS